MASNDLVFEGAPLLTGDLVFGDDGSNPITDAVIDGAVTLAKPTLSGTVVLGVRVVGAATLTKPTLRGEVVYNTDTARPLVAQAVARWQDAVAQSERAQHRFQDAGRAPQAVEARWQSAVYVFAHSEIRWHDADRRARQSLQQRFQDGERVQRAVEQRFQEAQRGFRPAVHVRYADALPSRDAYRARYRDAVRGVAGQRRMRYQDAAPLQTRVHSAVGSGTTLNRGWGTRYQDAKAPIPGRTNLHPVEPPVEPCYTPDTDLVFEMPWSTDTNLVFLCERHVPPEPGDTIVVPIRRVYMVLNDVSLRRVEGNVPIPTISMSMSLDVDSWTWSFGANLPTYAKQYVEPNSAGDPVEVEALVNGVAYRLLVESLTRDRTFNQDSLRIGGRGLAATLDSPYAPILNFGNPLASRTAQQLMGDVLTLNGVPLDWTVDWQIEDWVVPAGIWTARGSYISGLQSIVKAAGGYLQPVPSAKSLRALLRYPQAPWNWGDVVPDFELPSAVTTREGIEWVEKARYNRVFVSGTNAGVNGQVTRAGTDGSLAAEMVTDSLIVDAISARQRGVSILSDTGRIATVSLRLPVLEETGVIPPGKFVRYVDGAVTRIGITRSVSLDVALPEVFQTISVETHE